MSFSALIRVTQTPTRMEEEAHGRKNYSHLLLCDDLLKAIGHHESSFPQHLNDAEVMTIALVAASCFQGRHDPARFMLAQHGYIPGRISKSRFNLRLHRLKETVATVPRSEPGAGSTKKCGCDLKVVFLE